ncbi:MAG TPA: NIPSNAP family protein [Bacteroidia bacterium]|nr:NIPSNAP family protein [Bacteroidia bacterium]
MIVVRDVFRLKFGKAREAKALLEEVKKIPVQFGTDGSRVLTDLIGPSYTLVLETNFKNLASFEQEIGKSMGHPEWKSWYEKFQPLVDSSYREVFTIVG